MMKRSDIKSVARASAFVVVLSTSGLIGMSAVPTSAWAQSITFNLKDAEIATVVATIAEVTGKNFIIDPRVKGKATIISSRPMSKEEAYQVFLSLLEVHGFAAIPSGKVVKIVPDVNAKQSTTPIASERDPGEGDEVVTRVIDVQNISAAQLVPILRPLVPQQGHLVAYQPTNVLIISDRAANIKRLVEIIKKMDRPGAESEVELITLSHASATEVVRVMSALMQQEKKDPAQMQVEGEVTMVADERTNSVLLGGDPTRRMRLRALIAHLDTPLESEGNTHVIYLRYAKAKDLVPVLTGLSANLEEEKKAEKGKESAKPAAPSQIQADEATNALVITAAQGVYRSLQAVIRQLDIRRAQVSVEAIIAEITSRRASEIGVQWLFDGHQAGDLPVGAVNFDGTPSISKIGGALSSTTGTSSTSGRSVAAGAVSALGTGITLGLGKFNSGTFNFAALIRALEGDGAVNVLSTPSIVTVDNVEASIEVGQKVPFTTGSYTNVGSTSSNFTSPFQTTSRETVGITLKVKPQINEGDAIKLELEQNVNSLGATTISGNPVTNERKIKTVVMAADGQTVVLGGLLSDNENQTLQKVPLLGDLPLLGALFRYKNTTKEKNNLMVFIRPTILRDSAITTKLTNSKYNYIRGEQLEAERRGNAMLDLTKAPVLPELPPEPIAPAAESSDAKTDAKSESVMELKSEPKPVPMTPAPQAAPPKSPFE